MSMNLKDEQLQELERLLAPAMRYIKSENLHGMIVLVRDAEFEVFQKQASVIKITDLFKNGLIEP